MATMKDLLNKMIDKINNLSKPTGVTAGEYGGYTSGGYYYIPNITVNEEGKITTASESALAYASSKSAGLMSTAMYNKLMGGSGNLSLYKEKVPIDGEQGIRITKCARYSFADGAMPTSIPRVYNVYAYIYLDENRTDKRLTPINTYSVLGTSGDGYSNYNPMVYVKFPEEYRSFNTETEVTYAILYEKYTSTSSM